MVFEQWLPTWRERAAGEEPVEPGSSLAAEDLALPVLPVSHLAWMNLLAAVDHLQALRDLWMGTKSLHAFASNTLLRSAILTASTCVYLLDDSPGVTRRERQMRAGLAAVSDFEDALQFHKAASVLADSLGHAAVQASGRGAAALDQRVDMARAAAKANGATAAQVRGGLKAYLCVKTAAQVLGRTSPGTGDRQVITVGLNTIWQQGSADAHGRYWQWQQRSRLKVTPHEDSLRMTVAANLDEVVMGLQAAFLVTNECWRLWDLRRLDHRRHTAGQTPTAPTGRGSAFVRSVPDRRG